MIGAVLMAFGSNSHQALKFGMQL